MSELQKRLRDWNETGAARYPSFYELEMKAADALDAQAQEIARLTACRDELREATLAIDDPAVNNLTTLPEAIRALRARAEAAERDAERYRWLRQMRVPYLSDDGGLMPLGLDAAIDAARGGA